MSSLSFVRNAVLLTLALASCISVKTYELPTFDLAVELEGPEHPMVFFEDDLDSHRLPSAVPFVGVVVSTELRDSRGTLAMHLKEMDSAYRADYFVVADGPPYLEGRIYSAMPRGLMVMIPKGPSLVAFAFRICPSQLGVTWNQQLMVTGITNATIREAGLLEGDTITSLCGSKVTAGLDSPSHEARLGLQAGAPFTLTWIRPGVGLMAATGTALANPNTSRNMPDGAEALVRKEREEFERGKPSYGRKPVNSR